MILFDTNVLMDMYLPESSRHNTALRLGNYLGENKITVRLPTLAMFELVAVFKNKLIVNKEQKYKEDPLPFKTSMIAITKSFIDEYLDVQLPYLKGADFLFLCIAAKEKIPFITEDIAIYKKAKEADLEVYKIQEFLDKFDIIK